MLRLATQNRRLQFAGLTTDGSFIDYEPVDDLRGGFQRAQTEYPDGDRAGRLLVQALTPGQAGAAGLCSAASQLGWVQDLIGWVSRHG